MPTLQLVSKLWELAAVVFWLQAGDFTFLLHMLWSCMHYWSCCLWISLLWRMPDNTVGPEESIYLKQIVYRRGRELADVRSVVLSNPGGMNWETLLQILEEHSFKTLVCFRHPSAIIMTVKRSYVVCGQCCEYEVCPVCMQTHSDLLIMPQQYANPARSEQSCLAFSGTFTRAV